MPGNPFFFFLMLRNTILKNQLFFSSHFFLSKGEAIQKPSLSLPALKFLLLTKSSGVSGWMIFCCASPGKCPKGNWINFQSRCYFNLQRGKVYSSRAKSICAQKGGQLVSQTTTIDERDFLAAHVFDYINYLSQALWTGILDKDFVHNFYNRTYRVKLCGNNTSLLYRDSWYPAPDCSAPHRYTCSINKGVCFYLVYTD